MKQENIIEIRDLREKAIGRIDVLDKVGDLLMLKDTEFATVSQIAKYFKVSVDVIKMQIFNNREEIFSDGVKEFTGKEVKSFLASKNILPTNYRGYFKADGQKFSNKNNLLFPKRAILRIGMLLRDSEIAKEIRTRLLDIIHDTEKESPQIIENIVAEISEEKQLMMDRVEAEMNGDYYKVSEINAKLFSLKNKRIEELEDVIDGITTHALSITESRDIINKLVRNIAIKSYKSSFSMAYGELYKTVNYKLGINIKTRDKKKSESYLHTLTEEETYKVEEIVKSWATDEGIDINGLLKLGSKKTM